MLKKREIKENTENRENLHSWLETQINILPSAQK